MAAMNQETSHPFEPPRPRVLEDLGLSNTMIRDILLKTIYRMSLEYVTDMAHAVAIPVPLVQQLVDGARDENLIEAMGSIGAEGTSEMRYKLSQAGVSRTRDALTQSEYYGAMPVPLGAFTRQSERQSVKNIRITAQGLMDAMGNLILPHNFLRDLGPAISSGRSLLLYGPPGNGKSAISNGIRDALGDHVFVPRAVEYSGQIITVYDPIVHERVKSVGQAASPLRRASGFDGRYLKCRRPAVITGGELELSMLDLTYNPVSRTYQAPLQMKATGGIFIVDDLGRQAESPQKLINRWIVPMEASYDILALQSGEKFVVPFDTLVIFSTNFHPNQLFDQAALRRVFFKIKVDGPTKDEFLQVLALVAKAKRMPLTEPALIHLLTKRYPEIDNVYANYHAPFLIDQILAICDYEGIAPQMTPDLIDRAWANLYVEESDFAH